MKKVDAYLEQPLAKAVEERERRAQKLLELDEAVGAAVEKLKERGLTSPYLRSFVVARINPLRFIKGAPPPSPTVIQSARGLGAHFCA